MKRLSIIAKLQESSALRTVHVEGIGDVQVRPLPIGAAMELQRASQDNDQAGVGWAIVRSCLLDEDGAPLFGDDDRALFDSLPMDLVGRLTDACGVADDDASEETVAGN